MRRCDSQYQEDMRDLHHAYAQRLWPVSYHPTAMRLGTEDAQMNALQLAMQLLQNAAPEHVLAMLPHRLPLPLCEHGKVATRKAKAEMSARTLESAVKRVALRRSRRW